MWGVYDMAVFLEMQESGSRKTSSPCPPKRHKFLCGTDLLCAGFGLKVTIYLVNYNLRW